MTEALTYVEIDVPAFVPTIVHLAFDDAGSSPVHPSDTNSEGYTHVWTTHGDARIDTGGPPFGSAMLSTGITTPGGYISTADASEFSLGEADFSIEFYFWNNTAVGTERNFAGQRLGVGGANTTRSWNIDISSTGQVTAKVHQSNTQINLTGTTIFGVSSRYHHVSFNRHGTDLLLFVDGILEASGTITGAINDSAGEVAIGRDGEDTGTPYVGWIDEFTMHRYARRTANFVPFPTKYPGVTNPITDTLDKTFRFAVNTSYLPSDIDAIPSLKEVAITPAIVSLGEDLGQRASVTCKFRDHRHVMDAEPFNTGTFWGKFRARYGLRLQGYPLRVIIGDTTQPLVNMETRHFIIDSSDGPTYDGEYQIIAKDVIKLADGDKAQAPVLSQGFLSADITAGATTCTLSPTGIGSNYGTGSPPSGKVAIGGSEICSFSRSGDVLTLTRAQNNTTAAAHSAQDRVQLVLSYTSQSPADIIYDLFVTYAGIDPSYITLGDWQTEINTYLNTLYTAVIAEPVSVSQLISELIEQVGLAIWWDDINQKIRLQVLRPIPDTADIFDGEVYMKGSLKVTEQPEKRLTQVYTYFGKINPLVNDDQINNYRSTSLQVDTAAEASYGSPAIKKIYSRWIPNGGRIVADTLGTVLLARFRDPPRLIEFDLLRGSVDTPSLGLGYQIGGWMFQEINGEDAMVGGQVTSLNPRADIFEVAVEEISENAFSTGASPDLHQIIIDVSQNNVNLRTMHDSLYGTPVSGDSVQCTINSGVVVGSTNVSTAAFTIGTWPAGVTVTVINNGRIQGKGGAGGSGAALTGGQGGAGGNGGLALKTTQAFFLNNISGQIWAGGGGGGGNGGNGSVIGGQTFFGVAGGGGGAGTNPGAGGIHSNGVGGSNATSGSAGTATAGGAGGSALGAVGVAGAGGGPGLNGGAGSAGAGAGSGAAGSGGTRGAALDGVSFITFAGGGSPNGDIRGRQIN